MKKFEIEMLTYTLTKDFIEVEKNMLNAFGLIDKAMWWFNGQDISVNQ